MKLGPRYKIAKRLGASIFEKTQSQKFAMSAERAAKNKRRSRGASEFGKQLLEKQKVRFTYGLSEKQFGNYVREAMESNGASPIEMLHQLLERRLDSIMYRLGIAPTRRAARQLVSHGHVTVNGEKCTVPSRRIFPGDKLAIRTGSKTRGLFTNFADKFAERPLPSWLAWDVTEMAGGINDMPSLSSADPAGDLVAVLSFYSR
jgi:small subunit ribosomal protein S4